MSGLLQRASLLSNSKGLAFNDYIQKYNFTLFGIFTQYNTFYYISESIGFNGKSILKSFSTLDFWEGTIPEENKVYKFSLDDNNIFPFLQFFTEEIQEEISSLNIIKKGEKIFLLGNKNFSEESLNNLSTLSESESNTKNTVQNPTTFEVDYENSVSDFLNKNNVEGFLCLQAKTALKNEIFNRIVSYFSKIGNTEIISEFSVKVSFNSQIDSSLLKAHLINNINEVLNDSAEKILWN